MLALHGFWSAENGESGRGKQQYGLAGKDLTIRVPPGTLVYEKETRELLVDLSPSGATFVIALLASIAGWLGYRHGLGRAARLERAARWARGGLGGEALYARAVTQPFHAVARELETGAEPITLWAVDAVGALGQRASRALRGTSPDSARAQQALLLAGTVVLLAFWTWSAR